MGIRIICPPGPSGGVITGHLDRAHDGPGMKIVVYQRVGAEWEPCEQTAVPARLWSCRVTPPNPDAVPVQEWMAMLLPEGVSPDTIPVTGDVPHAVAQAPASSLSIQLVEGPHERYLQGKVPSEVVGLFAFMWWHPARLGPEDVPGWDYVSPGPIELPLPHDSDTWTETVPKMTQYAVVHVRARRQERTLPSDYAHSTAFTNCIGIAILIWPGNSLTGVVTGLGTVYERSEDDDPFDEPRNDKLLQVAAWAIDSVNTKTPFEEPVLCNAAGYWKFDRLPEQAHSAVKFAIAVTTQGFNIPDGDVPEMGGEVIAVEEFTR